MYREKTVAFLKSTAFVISPVNFKGFVSLEEANEGEDTNWIDSFPQDSVSSSSLILPSHREQNTLGQNPSSFKLT